MKAAGRATEVGVKTTDSAWVASRLVWRALVALLENIAIGWKRQTKIGKKARNNMDLSSADSTETRSKGKSEKRWKRETRGTDMAYPLKLFCRTSIVVGFRQRSLFRVSF